MESKFEDEEQHTTTLVTDNTDVITTVIEEKQITSESQNEFSTEEQDAKYAKYSSNYFFKYKSI